LHVFWRGGGLQVPPWHVRPPQQLPVSAHAPPAFVQVLSIVQREPKGKSVQVVPGQQTVAAQSEPKPTQRDPSLALHEPLLHT
jgi:hypothetical protein